MTQEKIEKRIKELENALREALASVHAIQGALRDCDYWLGQIGKDDA